LRPVDYTGSAASAQAARSFRQHFPFRIVSCEQRIDPLTTRQERNMGIRTTVFISLIALLSNSSGAARIELHPETPLQPLRDDCWGGIANFNSPRDAWQGSALLDSLAAMGMNSLRWPDGSAANAYNWLKHGLYFDERLGESGIDALRFIGILRELEDLSGESADATLVYRFGTGSAPDAADFCEFFMAPQGQGLGALRDSLLAEAGITPGPIAVRALEIGNEIAGPWEWKYSWSAESASKYFHGGDAWRRVPAGGHSEAEDFPDWFSGWPGDTALLLRFPPMEPDSITVFEGVKDSLGDFILTDHWTETDDILSVPTGFRAFEAMADSSGILIGDGVSYGAQPDPGHFLVVEYKTLGHDGAIAMADSIRARMAGLGLQAPPIGYCYPPWNDDMSESEIAEALSHFDFQIRHWYGRISPPSAVGSENQAYVLGKASISATESWERGQSMSDSIMSALGLNMGWGITEWNYNLNEDAAGLYGPGGAGFTALYLALLAARPGLPDFLGAWHFATCHYGGHLPLFHFDGAQIEATTRALGFDLAHEASRGEALAVELSCDSLPGKLNGAPVEGVLVPELFALGSIRSRDLSLLMISSADAGAVAEACTLSTSVGFDELVLHLFIPEDDSVDASLFEQLFPLGPGSEYVFDLPARSLGLLSGTLSESSSAGEGDSSLLFRARGNLGPRPGVSWSGATPGTRIALYDVSGRRIAQSTVGRSEGSWTLPDRLSSGIYWARMESRVARIVKIR